MNRTLVHSVNHRSSEHADSPLVLILIGVTITILLFGLVLWDVFSAYGSLRGIERDEVALNHLDSDLTRLDQSLSTTALLAVTTGDTLWQNRYHNLESQLERVIAQAGLVLDTARTGTELSQIRAAHLRRVETELRSMDLAVIGERDHARQLLTSETYQQRKREYVESISTALNVLNDRQELNSRLLRLRLTLIGVFACLVLAAAWLRILHLQRVNLAARRQAEAERERLIHELTRKNDELERFSYTVSHDLRSPLISIRGFLKWAEREALAGNLDSMKVHFQRIADSAAHMEHFIEAILRLSRAERSQLTPEAVRLTDLARDAVELLHGRIDQRSARVDIAPDLPVVMGDRPRLMEVFLNLVDNALKFMGSQPQPVVEIGQRPGSNGAVVFVRDNGIGIAPDDHDRVFGLFEKLSSQAEGTGLGLALVKRIIEQHGGALWVESEGVNCGTAMCFTLPGAKLS